MKKRLLIFCSIIFIFSIIPVYLFKNSSEKISTKKTNTYNKANIVYNARFSQFNKELAHEVMVRPLNFSIKSSGFNSGDVIPAKYVCNKIPFGKNISIPINWEGAPRETKSFAVLMYDLNPVANNFIHWEIINIPSNISGLNEGASQSALMPESSTELKNSAGGYGYTGPCPPRGTGKHEYRIIVFALNTEKLNLSGYVPLNYFLAALNGKVLAQAEISGFFEE